MTPDAVAISDLDGIRHLAYGLQLSLGIVFLLAAIPKLRGPAAFVRSVAGYGLVPGPLVRPTAWSVVAVESFLAAAFLTGWLTAVALPLAAATLGAFLAAVAVNLRRGRRVPCGCFGGEGERISVRSMVRLSMLLGAVALLAVSPAAPVTLAELADEGFGALAYVIEAGGLALFFVLGATWLLSLREVAFVLRRLAPARAAVAGEPTAERAGP